MQWVKQIVNKLLSNQNLKKVIAVVFFVVIYVLVHFSYLGTNELNPDAVNWHKRSEQFVLAFKTKDFIKTNQHYHPGVTLMWIIGPSVELVKQFTNAGVIYSSENYQIFHFVSKTALMLVNLVLSLVLMYFLRKIIGFWKSFAVVFLMNIEPFFLGNSRILHMDILFSSLVAVCLTLAFYAFKSLKLRFFALSGFFAALTVLTRSVGIGIILYNLVFFVYTAIITKSRKLIALSGIFAFSVVLTCFALFPALWVKPIKTVDKIFSRSYQVGVEYGHNQIFMNQYTEDPGLMFYLAAITLKSSPFVLFGIFLAIVFGVIHLRKINKTTLWSDTLLCKNILSFTLFLLIFYAGYFLILNTSNKKIDRYILPLFFFFSYVSVWGYFYLFKAFDHVVVKLLVGLFFVVSIIYPIYRFSPYEFLYYSPLFKNSEVANNVISQKNFGIGIFHLKKFIDARYGCSLTTPKSPKNFQPVIYGGTYVCPSNVSALNIGLSDTKAMKELHGNSRTTDFRFNSPSMYDVLVLSIDEEMPKEVVEDNLTYIKDSSIFVNDVELWRIYVRKD